MGGGGVGGGGGGGVPNTQKSIGAYQKKLLRKTMPTAVVAAGKGGGRELPTEGFAS